MDIRIKNWKAQLKPFALLMVMLGVSVGGAFFMSSISGSAAARSQFYTGRLEQANDLEGLRMYYETFVASEFENELETQGYDIQGLCISQFTQSMKSTIQNTIPIKINET